MSDPNTPTPRRGFTQSLAEGRKMAHPVVVGITHSGISTLALRRAADEAAHRSAPLHVIVGGPVEATLDHAVTDEREVQAISSILSNRHVTVSVVDPTTPDALLEYCDGVGAALIVVGCDASSPSEELNNPATAHRLVDEADCDVLIVHGDNQHPPH